MYSKEEEEMTCIKCSSAINFNGFIIEQRIPNRGPYCSVNCAKSFILDYKKQFGMDDYKSIVDCRILKRC